MLSSLLRHKLSCLRGAGDASLRAELKAMLASPAEPAAGWQAPGRDLLSDFLGRMGREEGLPEWADPVRDLRDRVPNFVSNALAGLTEVLVAPLPAHPQEAKETAVHLLLKIAEWMARNYDHRCLYGEEGEARARALFDGVPMGVEVWGDLDEVWLAVHEACAGLGLERDFQAALPVFGCRGYGAEVTVTAPAVLGAPDFWAGRPLPASAVLTLALRSGLVDQVEVRCRLRGRGAAAASSGRLEGRLLAALVESCGAPESG
ncbi:hypothetical protein G3N55_04150 [Dissulfurirhabdus thermomarina]|uniref:Uncharacterized protein n=1 Tax=Dissulfurirhabdus thermomarina TaxID=1765737 RepID=A0A6N9TNN2_DISTH|nr:hypothetical protein [Dissulfurirhabdus thermomarina]NDY42040.1 hypothetical protein [Dissulfurirhabdus thermomarina]NMX22332.1 hypothetical protein [Dissulfurirhabdus thermomarina]